jgi:hypothetical protein
MFNRSMRGCAGLTPLVFADVPQFKAVPVLFFWLAYQHIPQVRALLDQLPALWQKRQIPFVV